MLERKEHRPRVRASNERAIWKIKRWLAMSMHLESTSSRLPNYLWMAQHLMRLNLVSTLTRSSVSRVCPRTDTYRTPIPRAVQPFVQFGSRLHEVHIDSLRWKRPGYRLTRFNCNRCKSCVWTIRKRFRPGANENVRDALLRFAAQRIACTRLKLYDMQQLNELNVFCTSRGPCDSLSPFFSFFVLFFLFFFLPFPSCILDPCIPCAKRFGSPCNRHVGVSRQRDAIIPHFAEGIRTLTGNILRSVCLVRVTRSICATFPSSTDKPVFEGTRWKFIYPWFNRKLISRDKTSLYKYLYNNKISIVGDIGERLCNRLSLSLFLCRGNEKVVVNENDAR